MVIMKNAHCCERMQEQLFSQCPTEINFAHNYSNMSKNYQFMNVESTGNVFFKVALLISLMRFV